MTNEGNNWRGYMTVSEAVAMLGDDGERILIDAHIAGRVTLVAWREGSSPAHGPIPAEVFANAMEFEPHTNSIVPSANVADFGEFERNYRHLNRWTDVKVRSAEIDSLVKTLAAQAKADAPGTFPELLAPEGDPEPAAGGPSQLAGEAAGAVESLRRRIDNAILTLAAEGVTPGKGGTTLWKNYYDLVWERCRISAPVRGDGPKTIQRRVRSLRTERKLPP